MKRRLLMLSLALSAMTSTAAADAPAPPPFTLPGTQVRTLAPTAAGRHYQLAIHLPASFATSPKRRYPVLYITDAYWDFPLVVAAYGSLVYDRVVPEFIIVGLGYAGPNPDVDTLRM